jgi:hypothetical protein
MADKSIIILIPYFGQWPEWIDLFLVSCQWNSTIHWVFITDCGAPTCLPENVRFVHMSFDEYRKLVSERLEIQFPKTSPYKLCDYKPTYGFVHEDLVSGYDYFGFGDIDVIYGNIRRFYTSAVLSHSLISTHYDRLSGHFCLVRNTEFMRQAFRQVKDWQTYLEDPEHRGFDEHRFRRIVLRHKKYPRFLRKVCGWFDPYQRGTYFKEQYSTILSPIRWLDGSYDHPQEWLWRKGRLTNTKDGEREFLYLHFMNWKSSRYLRKYRGEDAPWENLDRIVHFDVHPDVDSWRMTRRGFHLP